MKKPKRAPHLETNVLPDGHAVIVNIQTEWAHTVTPLGVIIWEFCDGTSTVEEIIHAVSQIPELSGRENLRAEIEQFIQEFSDEGFISI